MDFIWAGDRKEVNQQRIFYIDVKNCADRLEICAVDNYQVFFDGEFVSYGPERTAAGYSRKKILSCKGVSLIEIKVISHGIPVYMCDFQPPFFGAEIYAEEQRLFTSKDFACRVDVLRDAKVCRYSVQRGFIEKQILAKAEYIEVETYPVSAPVILSGVGDRAKYTPISFEKISEGEYQDFRNFYHAWWEERADCLVGEGYFDTNKDFAPAGKGYQEKVFALRTVKTGFLKVEVDCEEEGDVFIAFEEILFDGQWDFKRSACNDLFVYNCTKGKHISITAEPYAMKYIKVIYKGKIDVKPTLILYENEYCDFIEYTGEEKIVSILDAAKNTFAQNAVDLFTDCPGRERAGWLCDSFFTAKAERLFTGDNAIERNFLENFILSNTEELPKGMLPMCYPSQHSLNRFIPNWAMWFVVELKDYLARTNDRDLIDRAKEKVYGVIEYFKKFKNEFGLLENLESWIFVEWSIANSADYVKGINFPSNMLYSAMLKSAGTLYADDSLLDEAERVKEAVCKYAYNGEFFIDNGETVEGKICLFNDHISETCQYYALFLHITEDEQFACRIKENFGPNRKAGFDHVGKSNVFIGNYLRLFWLCERKEYDLVLNESIEYFYKMSKTTGTLWEHDLSKASCNHGFASVIAVILLNALIGYDSVENGALVLKENFSDKKYVNVCKNARFING